MGKEYWYWGGSGRSSKRGGGRAETEIPSGCMCAVFQAFDFHPFNFSINHQQQQQPTFKSPSNIPDNQNVPKGAEAQGPRNSLESQNGTVSTISKEENLKFPNNIRIKTSGGTRTRGGSFDDISSPGTKTPTLVARLMGLDLLPDANSSSSSSSSCLSTPNKQGHSNQHHNRPKQHRHIVKHRHSTDSAIMRSSARKSDVEHRLSLQINKENMNIGLGEDLEGPRFSFSKRKFDDNNNSRSPSHYARQIVKQVKESVSRKVGIDITNTVKNREEFVGQFKFKKPPKTSENSLDESSPGKHSNTSYSPRLSRFNDTNYHKTSPISTTPKDQNRRPVLKPSSPPPVVAQVPRVSTKPKSQDLSEKEIIQNQKSLPKSKKTTHGNLSSRLNKPPQTSIRNKQEESFIIRPPSKTTRANDFKTKNKRTHPLSANLLNNPNNTVPNLLLIKTDPSPPATKIPPKQVSDDAKEAKRSARLFSCSRQKYKQEATQTLDTRGGITKDESKSNGAFTAAIGAEDDEGPEYEYITAILSRTGIHRAKIPHLHFQWFSSTHPLDPSLFHRLELYPTSNFLTSFPNNDKDRNFTLKNHLGPRCNRRLLFDLVDEVLSEILVRPKRYRGLLLETVWKSVLSFPRAKCEFLEDIDGLIEMEDMKEEEDERERLVAEIEGKIVETLVHETFTVMVGWVRMYKTASFWMGNGET